jgi:hypothetical protein
VVSTIIAHDHFLSGARRCLTRRTGHREPGIGITGEPAQMDCASHILPLEACSARGSPVIDSTGIDMVAQRVKIRLSLAAFAPAGDLCEAIEDLGKIGVTPDQFLLAAQSSAQAALAVKTAAKSSMAVWPLLTQMQPTQDQTPHGPIYASDPEAWNRISAKHSLADDDFDGAHRWGVARRLTLIDEIDSGSTVLIVRATSFSQHRRSVRILLKHGNSRVLTHEFADQPPHHTHTESKP